MNQNVEGVYEFNLNQVWTSYAESSYTAPTRTVGP